MHFSSSNVRGTLADPDPDASLCARGAARFMPSISKYLLELLGNQPLYTFRVEGSEEIGTRVVEFEGVESVSGCYEYRIRLACADDNIGAILDREGALKIESLVDARYVHGYVHQVDYVGRSGPFALLELRLVPQLWCLHNRRASRIFQAMSTPDIVLKILGEHGIPTTRIQLELSEQYAPRDYCVQYRESDLDFVSRLLEDEGIFYYFKHTEKDHVLVLGDVSGTCPDLPEGARLPYREESGLINEGEHVRALGLRESMRPGRVSLRDFYFPRPADPMEVTRQVTERPEWELYDQPGGYRDPGHGGPDSGEVIAKVRLEAVQAARRELTGESDSPRLLPGHRMTIDDHPTEYMNGEFLLLRVHLRGRQPQVLDELGTGGLEFASAFTCIPAKTHYRPPRTTPRPTVHGLQSGTVSGPEGEEIHVDAQGRVLVQFHWDRRDGFNERSSCWIRVSHQWAGGGYGAVALPRIGHEVLVDFLGGDPDRPIVVGRVYHGNNAHPYPLPEHKTRSTFKTESSPGGAGYNELRFEDRKGAEEIFVHAEKDLNGIINHCETRHVGASRSTTIGTVDHVICGTKQVITIAQPPHPPATIPPTGTEMSNTKYRLTTGQATLTLDGPNITLEADGFIKLLAKGLIEINSSAAEVKVEGATTVSVAAKGGDLKLNGGPMVKINM